MFKAQLTKRLLVTIMTASFAQVSISANVASTHHNDFRDGLKIDFLLNSEFKTTLKKQAQAYEFLSLNKSRYDLETNFEDLRFVKSKSSLLGEHYYYQQYLNDLPVDKAEVIVSVSKKNEVVRVFNNTFPVINEKPNVHKNILSTLGAETRVWDFLQASGDLRITPRSKLVYLNIGANFKLAYKVNMTVSKPYGDWEFYLDARSGNVINATRIDLPISKNANEQSEFGKWKPFKKNPAQKSYNQAISAIEANSNKVVTQVFNKADATALVFDPNPVTTLNNDTLEDTSPASSFDAAYTTVTLKDLTLNNGTYSLVGPWVTVVNFENPATSPSVSTDGIWDAKRGDNAFNDAMTYYHIDQNQRYMQSLGFVDATGIQSVSIEVDTDAANGDDQSYFSPSANQLAFGHGCVDDNEDSDVILHEYGHAINTSINSSWSGGDTGAMGEGFGDYWAVSYSLSTANGRTVHPEWVFSWDGHNNCWGGRLVNQTSFRYDPTATYGAHAVVGGVLGDELWSTPLAESLIQLLDAGVPRSEVDQIILESQFGLGANLKMPDLAASIVATANRLFPNGQHADVFNSQFKLMNILGDPLEAESVEIIDAGGNAIADPGETVTFNIPLKNNGGVTVTQVSSTISTTSSGVTISSASSNYADLTASSSQTNLTLYELVIPDTHSCGLAIPVSLAVTYNENGTKNVTLDSLLKVGQHTGNITNASSSPGTSIPDNNATGITEEITISGAEPNSAISIDLNITHTYRGDLALTLTSPTGTSVILTTTQTDEVDNIVGNFPNDLTPVASLSAFEGEDHNGVWSLKIVDAGPADLGTLNSWTINSIASVCGNSSPVASVAESSLSVSEGSSVNLDASSSSDPDGDTLSYAWIQTSGTNLPLSGENTSVVSFTASIVGDFSFIVTVTDTAGATDTATVNVTVNASNQAPTAVIQTTSTSVNEGASFSLNGSTSSDPDGDTLTYAWSQLSGSSVTLNSATSATSTFTAPSVNNAIQLSFRLTVTDPSGEASSADITITVNDIPESGGGNSGGNSGGGSGSLQLFSLLGLLLIKRLRKVNN